MPEGKPEPIPARVKELLDELSDLTQTERDEALMKLAATEPPMIVEILRRLLKAHDGAGTFLAPVRHPKTIGPYTLERRIGEGGFGEVWVAEQGAPVRRRVAIKLIKPGMDSRTILARFDAERQALAIMEHPNIARVFDAGATPEGRPFFVMEYVDGLPITTFADAQRMTIAERLNLFLPVCRAVHHAHQKGVIHRDIKPANVLVATVDGAFVPKIIDFGIAKAVDEPLTERTIFTEQRAMIGTPEYMSPEQAEIGIVDIDTRTDVYSLGVLLYELLAGVTPFDPAELRRKAYGELQRIIREVEPPAPSARAGSIATSSVIADARRTEAGRLSRSVRGELDWIVMKCLEKDRARRYDSASALAIDLENYLSGNDVVAGPPSKVYRFRKMVRRNRGLFVGIAAVSVALIAGLIGTLVMLREARRQERIARDAATRATVVSDFLQRTITSADPYQQIEVDPRLSQVLEYAIAQLDSGALSTQPEVEASLRTIVGRTLGRIDQHQRGERMLRQVVHFRRSQSPRDDAELARALMLLGANQSNQARFADADALFREATDIAKAAGNERLASELQFNIATAFMSRMNYAAAVPLLQQVVDFRRKNADRAPVELADGLETLGHAEARAGNAPRAVELLSEALQLRQKHQPPDALAAAETSALLAEALSNTNRNDEAIVVLEKAIDAVKGRASGTSGTSAMLHEVLGRRYANAGNYQRAADLVGDALAIRRKIDGPNHLRTGRAHVQLGEQLFRLARVDEARDNFRAGWEILGGRKDYPMSARVEAASQLAALTGDNDTPKASELFEFSMTYYRSLPQPTPQYYKCAVNYFNQRYVAGDYAVAAPLAEETLKVAQAVFPGPAVEIAMARSYVARVQSRWAAGDLARAEEQARAAVAEYERIGQSGAPAWLSTQGVLGEILVRQNRPGDAEPLLELSLNGLKKIENPSPVVRRAIGEAEQRLRDLAAARAATQPATAPAQP